MTPRHRAAALVRDAGDSTPDGRRGTFAQAAVAVGSTELELAATAAYLRLQDLGSLPNLERVSEGR